MPCGSSWSWFSPWQPITLRWQSRAWTLLDVSPAPGGVLVSSQSITGKPSASVFSFGDTKWRRTVFLKPPDGSTPRLPRARCPGVLFVSSEDITHSQQNVAWSVFPMSFTSSPEKLPLLGKMHSSPPNQAQHLCVCLWLLKTPAFFLSTPLTRKPLRQLSHGTASMVGRALPRSQHGPRRRERRSAAAVSTARVKPCRDCNYLPRVPKAC